MNTWLTIGLIGIVCVLLALLLEGIGSMDRELKEAKEEIWAMYLRERYLIEAMREAGVQVPTGLVLKFEWQEGDDD